MSGTVARVAQISASSEKSYQDAIRSGIDSAASEVPHISRAWITGHNLSLDRDGQVNGYQVRLRVVCEATE